MENRDYVKRNCDHYSGHRYQHLNKRKYGSSEVDICIVGAGAAGSVLACELSRAGLEVVVVEAGPFWNPQTDFASDELAMQKLAWNDTRIVSGSDPLSMGHNNSGRGVGGGTVHFTGVFYRFHESDFRTKTLDGVGEDWPITYRDLEPYYSKIEQEIKVSGPRVFPWGAFHGPYPYPEREPISANAQVFRRGCEAVGLRSTVAPLAILSAPFDGRPPCTNRGFCNQGCMPNAKYSALIHHIPKAIGHGAEILTDCMVTRILTDRNGDRVTGVEFVHDGQNYRQEARLVIVSAFVVETSRLLLNSATPRHPEGLANSSGLVGKYIMPHTGHDIYARFDDEIRFYKGTPVLAVSQEFYETDPQRGFVRGYTFNAHGSRPVAMAKTLAASAGIWGKQLREIMIDFNFYARVTLVGEVLPSPDNTVTLTDEKDEYGLPRALVTFSYGDNDNKLIAHGVAMSNRILEAAGGRPAFVVPDTAHLHGGCRMGLDPQKSVVNRFCQSHDIPNLYICDASVFVTSGGANPTETVMAIAARTADHLIDSMSKGRPQREPASVAGASH
ncbi:GMC family oxidoreductase [Phosphitispora fastidiosa]|uniref:GMC family oxidoreductase n=1 Tax=Phosphitispora fastidiosa TaxID=2837202 RepID=UPI001E448621|nr:GMC family oxidoreductase [Phosphitispora fastidiosa]MBU7005707.1 choline dehydrogenase-like flavoprotein [Phosphitispora fastidiosa]